MEVKLAIAKEDEEQGRSCCQGGARSCWVQILALGMELGLRCLEP